jgi:hypothetical protein
MDLAGSPPACSLRIPRREPPAQLLSFLGRLQNLAADTQIGARSLSLSLCVPREVFLARTEAKATAFPPFLSLVLEGSRS